MCTGGDVIGLFGISAGLSGIVLMGVLLWYYFPEARGGRREGTVDLGAWESVAAQRGWSSACTADRQHVSGQVEGHPFTAEATITRRTVRTRYSTQTYLMIQGTIRVPVRGRVPAMRVMSSSFVNKLRALVSGNRPMVTDVMDFDEHALITGDDVDAVVPLLRNRMLAQAIVALLDEFPRAVVHDTAVELPLTDLLVTERRFERAIDLLTTVAAAIEAYVPGAPAAAQAIPVSPEVSSVVSSPTSASAPPTARRQAIIPEAHQNVGSLYSELNSLSRAPARQQRMAAQHIRIPPHRFRMEVRSIAEATTRTGMSNGNYRLAGVLLQNSWRVELEVDKAQANEVLTLVMGDVVEGTCLIDDVWIPRLMVEGRLTSPLTRMEDAVLAPTPEHTR